jgi:hypothetical protein
MAGNKYMTLSGGKKVLEASVDTSAGAGDAGKIVALDAEGKIDPSMLRDIDNLVVVASEGLSAGDYINLWDDTGTVKARKADNSNGRDAHGYVTETVLAAANVTVFFEGANTDLSGLTLGARVYLGVTGDVIQTPLDPVADAGKIHQFLGIAVSATSVNVDIADCISL